MEFTEIRTEEEYKQALARLEEIFNAKSGSKEYEELQQLSQLIDDYEDLQCGGDDDE